MHIWPSSGVLLCALAGSLVSRTSSGGEPPAPAGTAEAVSASALPPQGPIQDISPRLESVRDTHKVPALAIAVVRGSGVVARGVVGVRERGSDVPATIDDLWHLGSCTKAMTATLCAMLVEEGRLTWDTTLGQVFPTQTARAPSNAAWKNVTLRQLLQHRASLRPNPDKDGLWAQLWVMDGPVREQRSRMLDAVLTWEPGSTPGTRFEYSNLGYILAGMMAEQVLDQSIEDALTSRLFEPLGLSSAGFGAPGAPRDNAEAIPDQPRGHAGGKPVQPGRSADNPPVLSAAGRAHMTITDWGRFIAQHVVGERGESALLPASAFEALHQPAEGGEYALGWIVTQRPWAKGTGPEDRGRVLTHAGSNTMWFAQVWIAPERNVAVLACTNEATPAAQKAVDQAIGIGLAWLKDAENAGQPAVAPAP